MAFGLTGVRPEPTIPPIIGTRAGWLWPGHHVIIQSWTGTLAVVALLTADPPKPTQTGSEWEVYERPRNTGITEWRGRRNKREELPILLDGWDTRAGGPRFVDGLIDALEEMADTPHTIRVIGPIPYWGRQWAIENIAYGPCIRDAGTGRTKRQELTLELLEFIAPDELAKLPRAGAEPTKTRDYKIVKGDDLKKIAQKTLKKAARWNEIVKLNAGMRGVKLDPKKFGPGKKIKVPAK
jgi:hypothetical protein